MFILHKILCYQKRWFLCLFFPFSLLISINCWGILVLENSKIMDIHKEMAMVLQKIYETMPYGASIKFNDLCTARLQFVYKNNEENVLYITEPEPLKGDADVVTTSSFTEKLYDIEQNKTNPYKALSWPFFPSTKDGNNKLRDILGKDVSGKNIDTKTKIYSTLYSNGDNLLCAQALDLTLEQYNLLISNANANKSNLLNPINYLKSKYNYNSKHSEALLIWWIERHLEELKNKLILQEQNKITILYPIIHFHTRKQTCHNCEKLIQKSAKTHGYVPITSFSSLYNNSDLPLNLKQEFSSYEICISGQTYKYCSLPFSQPKNNFLTLLWAGRLSKIESPLGRYNYLQQKYPINEGITLVNFDEYQKNIRNLFYYKKHNDLLEGVERFPIQFYVSST